MFLFGVVVVELPNWAMDPHNLNGYPTREGGNSTALVEEKSRHQDKGMSLLSSSKGSKEHMI
jgi:hypothetical protein